MSCLLGYRWHNILWRFGPAFYYTEYLMGESRLAGEGAVVTGGRRGLGHAMALGLTQADAEWGV